MAWGIAYPLSAIREASETVAGWTGVIIATSIMGFFPGYWLGHGEITEFSDTLAAMVWIPIVWLGHPQMFIAYAATALAWYVPIHFESLWLRVTAAIANVLTWLIVVAWVVELCSHHKFWQW